MEAKTILSIAREVVENRASEEHGPKDKNHQAIAILWNAYLKCLVRSGNNGQLTAHNVAVMMALLKIARTITGSPIADHYIDAAGYMACAAELVDQNPRA